MVSRGGGVLLFAALLSNYVSFAAAVEEVCFSSSRENNENASCKGLSSNVFEQILAERHKEKNESSGIPMKGERTLF